MAEQRPIRVLEILSGFAVEGPLGGMGRFCISLARALDKEVVEPVMCGLWDWHTPFDAVWLAQLHDWEIDAFMAAPKDDDAPYRNYLQVVRGIVRNAPETVDIIHSHSEFGDVAALVLRRQLGAKAVIRTVHNEAEWAKRPLRRLLLTNVLYPLAFDAEFGVSQQVVANLDQRPLARCFRRRGGVLYNAIDFGRFNYNYLNAQEKREELSLPEDAIILGSIGRLAPQKGYGILLDAFARVHELCPTAYLVLVGHGEDYEQLVQRAKALEIDQNVRLVGSRSDIEALLALFDLFVSSSLWEGLPTVILESMAAGTAVIATNVSGSTELVKDGETGLLVPPGNAEALSSAIMYAIQQPEALKKMASNAQEMVQREFSIDLIARQHEEIYLKLVTDQN